VRRSEAAGLLSPAIGRPLLFAVAFACGLGAAAPLRAVLLLPPLLVVLLPSQKERRPALILSALGLLSGGLIPAVHGLTDPLPGLLRAWEAEGVDPGTTPIELRARVVEAGRIPGERVELVVRILESSAVGGCRRRGPPGRPILARLTAPDPGDGGGAWQPGRRLDLTARIAPPRNFGNPGAFDYRSWLRARGIVLVGTIKATGLIRPIPDSRPGLTGAAARLRGRLVRRIDRACGARGGRTAAFLAALLLGERRSIDPELERLLQRAGVYHIVALSGLNVALVALAAAGLLRLSRCPPAATRLVAGGAVLAYWLVAKGSGSIARAALMGLLFLAGGMAGRRVRGAGMAAVSAVLLLASSPASLFDAGFQLSYAATFALVLAPEASGGRGAAGRPPIRAATAALGASARAAVGTSLVAAHHFHTLTPAALVANLAAVPIASLLLFLALAIVTLEPLSFPVAAAGARLAGGLLGLLEWTAGLCAAFPWASFHVVPPGALLAAGSVAALPFLRRPGPVRWFAAAGLAVSLCVVAAAGRTGHPSGRLEVVMFDVGQGDSILLRLPEGGTILVDAGGFGRTGFDVGERVVAPALRSLGVLSIDLLAITHGHRDHLGGAGAILEAFRPRALWTGPLDPRDPVVRDLERRAEALGASIVRPRRGVWARMGGATMTVLNPAGGAGDRGGGGNDDSLVLRVTHAGAGCC
jgi:competence protein ComEC